MTVAATPSTSWFAASGGNWAPLPTASRLSAASAIDSGEATLLVAEGCGALIADPRPHRDGALNLGTGNQRFDECLTRFPNPARPSRWGASDQHNWWRG